MNTSIATTSMSFRQLSGLQPALSCCSTLVESEPPYEQLYDEPTQSVPEVYCREERQTPSHFNCNVSVLTWPSLHSHPIDPVEVTPLLRRDPSSASSCSFEWSSSDILAHPKIDEVSSFAQFVDLPFDSHIDTSFKDSPPSSSIVKPPAVVESFSLIDTSTSDDVSPFETPVSPKPESPQCPEPEKIDSSEMFPLPRRTNHKRGKETIACYPVTRNGRLYHPCSEGNREDYWHPQTTGPVQSRASIIARARRPPFKSALPLKEPRAPITPRKPPPGFIVGFFQNRWIDLTLLSEEVIGKMKRKGKDKGKGKEPEMEEVKVKCE